MEKGTTFGNMPTKTLKQSSKSCFDTLQNLFNHALRDAYQSTTDKINLISNHFKHRQRHEYVVNLRETQSASKLNINSQKLCCASL